MSYFEECGAYAAASTSVAGSSPLLKLKTRPPLPSAWWLGSGYGAKVGHDDVGAYDFLHVSLTVTTRPPISVNEVVIVFSVSLTFMYTSGAYEAMSGTFVWITYV